MVYYRFIKSLLHLLEIFILSGTGEALIIPRTIDSFTPNTKFKLLIILRVEINRHIKIMVFCHYILSLLKGILFCWSTDTLFYRRRRY